MYIACPRLITRPSLILDINENDIINILDTDDGVMEFYNHQETVQLTRSLNIAGLILSRVGGLKYNCGHIKNALKGKLILKGRQPCLYYNGRGILYFELSRYQFMLKDAEFKVIFQADIRDEVDYDAKIKGVSIPWLEKIGEFYRVIFQVRIKFNTDIMILQRIDFCAILDKNGLLGIEAIELVNEHKLNNFWFDEKYRCSGGGYARIALAKPIANEFKWAAFTENLI